MAIDGNSAYKIMELPAQLALVGGSIDLVFLDIGRCKAAGGLNVIPFVIIREEEVHAPLNWDSPTMVGEATDVKLATF